MFAHQQTLPIRYFDTNEHGDIMSRYTNDTDTLRQAISQSFPQMFSSAISARRTGLHAVAVGAGHDLRARVRRDPVRSRARHRHPLRPLLRQAAEWIGDVNAFVEESVNGQKVIKVFNHEDATQKTFDEKNEELFTRPPKRTPGAT